MQGLLVTARGLQLALVCIAFLVLPASAAMQEEIATPGGPLAIRQLDEGKLGKEFVVMLGYKQVIRTREGDEKTRFNDFPVPRLLHYVGKPIPPFDAVAVFQQFSWGNACNGGPIWFLGIRKNGTYSVSGSIDYCGGADPLVSVISNAIRVVLPAPQPQKGKNEFGEEIWIYEHGKLKHVNSPGSK